MALTNKEKQAAFKERKRQAGLVELRNLYVKREQNTKEVKAMVADFIRGLE